jgi:type II secretory pathway component GspD/PulD (secretin)
MIARSAAFAILAAGIAASSLAQESYYSITDLNVRRVANAIQIEIKADGMIDAKDRSMGGYEYWDYDGGSIKVLEIVVDFPSAMSGLSSNYMAVNQFPVSDMRFDTMEGAVRGIGLTMTIRLLEASQYRLTPSDDGQALYINIVAKRYESVQARSLEPHPGREQAAPGIEIGVTNGLVSIKANNAEIHEFFSTLAKKTGINIAVDDGVKRVVSTTLFDLAPGEVVEKIAAAFGLGYRNEGGVYLISEGIPNSLATYRETVTEMIPMKYVPASRAVALLPNFLRQYAMVDAQHNAVIVSAPQEMVAKVREDLGRVDEPPALIMVEALVVEFRDTRNVDLGFDYSLINEHGAYGVGIGDPENLGDVTFSNLGTLPSEFDAKLQALVQNGQARIRATPRMAAMNGSSAQIFIGRRKYVAVKSGYFETMLIRQVDVGVKLDVTPWTGGTGQITTALSTAVSNISAVDPTTGLPELTTREASTTVRVGDGETIAVGGLKLKERYAAESKIPLLGDIPLVGKLFRSRHTNENETELVIFVTPRILGPDGHLPDEEYERLLKEQYLNPKEEPGGGKGE